MIRGDQRRLIQGRFDLSQGREIVSLLLLLLMVGGEYEGIEERKVKTASDKPMIPGIYFNILIFWIDQTRQTGEKKE